MFSLMTATARAPTSDDAGRRRLRDAAFDGAFVFAVRTTGVYCRPSCASRPAKPENVAFFATPEAAEKAGFRACKRCRPDRAAGADRSPPTVRRACERIEAAEEPPSSPSSPPAAALEPVPFPPDVQGGHGRDARGLCAPQTRARRAEERLRTAETVTEAIYDAGFDFEPLL